MPRILLLCFVHGFKGGDNTFRTFPEDLKQAVAGLVPDHDRVETVVYPRYETKGELAAASAKFLEWLKARVMDVRKAHLDTPWPPNDRQVGVVLVAHSMGGFVAADALFLALDEQKAAEGDSEATLFPPIQGLLALDTPYNGLSRSMFVYGAFSNYSKVQTVFNVMTALSAGPIALGRLALGRAGKPSSSGPSSGSSTAAWKVWQLVAVRTGTVGAIAAGGVAAYTHRKSIMAGVDRVRQGFSNRGKEDKTQEGGEAQEEEEKDAEKESSTLSLRDSYQSSIDAIGQGLAYINRRNVGESFAWLSAHFTFVGALLKQAELNHRLQRLAGLRGGLGVHDMYVSLGANGYWSGGYFVPERTFCAIPDKEEKKNEKEKDTKEKTGEEKKKEKEQQKNGREDDEDGPASLFERWTMSSCEDEVQAHISLFKRDKNPNYDAMTRRSAVIVASWFANDEPVVDTVGPLRTVEAEVGTARTAEEDAIRVTDEGVEIVDSSTEAAGQNAKDSAEDSGLPDESPIDIAATASLMERAGGSEGATKNAEKGSTADSAIVIDDDDDLAALNAAASSASAIPEEDRATYLRHLLSVAQNAGTGLKRVSEWSSQLPAKMPRIDGMALPSMPAMPSMPTMAMPSMPKSASTLIPSTKMFSRSKGDGPSGSSASSVSGKEDVERTDKMAMDGISTVKSTGETAAPPVTAGNENKEAA
ncbi:hypothetical protein SEUCBS140593_002989 [Sporothrix eucalyptigena]|uniref:DUF676 domain-containing protein n=1 Tax=Sporothrix eucalyptigena TaxID=1812306 RepID=A0ABP0BB75_9PEZI